MPQLDATAVQPSRRALVGAAWWKLRWTTLVVVLLAVSLLTAGWLSLACVYGALVTSVWRGLKLMPTTGGMHSHRQ